MTEKIEEAVLETGEYSIASASAYSVARSSTNGGSTESGSSSGGTYTPPTNSNTGTNSSSSTDTGSSSGGGTYTPPENTGIGSNSSSSTDTGSSGGGTYIPPENTDTGSSTSSSTTDEGTHKDPEDTNTGSNSSSSTDEGTHKDPEDTDTGSNGSTTDEDGVYEDTDNESSAGSSSSNTSSSCSEYCIEDRDDDPQEDVPESKAYGSTVADPVDAYSGAHTIKNNILSLYGGQNISLTAHYNSSKLTRGSLGIGWYHNYEKHLVASANEIKIYDNPATFCRYRSCSDSNVYSCETLTKLGYVLTVTDDEEYPYCLNCNSEKLEYYNSSGLLAKVVSHQGFETLITYSEDTVTIKDTVTGKCLYLKKDETGKIVRVYDDAQRETVISYCCNYLRCIYDPNENGLTYTYHTDGKIKSGIDSKQICYFENTYNLNGQVIRQNDAESLNPTKFEYSGNSRKITNRNKDTSTRVFNAQGLLTEFTDENCNTKKYEYDDRCNIIKETDGNGKYVTATYNRFNKPETVTDKLGHITTYEYDANGNVTKITYPNAAFETYEYNERNQVVKHKDLRGTETVYTYNANGLPESKKIGNKAAHTYVYENGLLVSEKDPLGNETRYEYNSLGLVCKKSVVFKYTENGETLQSSYDTKYEYDLTGNITKITDANNKTIEYTYDANYQKVSSKDANGNVTKYSYNGNMKPVKTTYADASFTLNEYDDEDRVIAVHGRNEAVSYMTYDKGGRLVKKTLPDGTETSYVYDGTGHVLTETNHYGAVVTKNYDDNGNVVNSSVKESETADNITTEYTYDCMSRVATKETPAGAKTTYTYNNAGDLTEESTALDENTNIVKSYEYDAYGNKIKFTDPNGNITTYTYDDNNNLVSVKCYTKAGCAGETDPYLETKYIYDHRNLLIKVFDARVDEKGYHNNYVEYKYDALGRRTHVIDARRNTTETLYDDNGNVVKIIDARKKTISASEYNVLNLASSVTGASGKTTVYTYNKLGKPAVIEEFYDDTILTSNTYSYNLRGQNIAVDDPTGNTSSAEYDLLGNITVLKGPGGGETKYTYDALGRLIGETTTSGGAKKYTYNCLSLKETLTNARNQTRVFSYDKLGRITGYTSVEGNASFTYDNNGNVLTATDSKGTVTRTFDALNRITSYTDTLGNAIQYTYDCVGNLEKITYPGNKSVLYEYDENNNLVKVIDWANRITTYTYDENNLVISVIKPDGSVTTTDYDDAHRVISSITRIGDAVISGFEYEYDDFGRISSESDLANELKMCYTYDTLSRVINRTAVSLDNSKTIISTENFNYNPAGNMTIGMDESVVYDNNNRIVEYRGSSVIYDADGNMLMSPIGEFTYDSANRLTTAGTTVYTYDVENIRTKKCVGETITEYTHNANSKLSQLLMKTENGVTTYYVYGRGLIGEEVNGAFKTYHYDYRGSTVAITDETGAVTDRFGYDTYGRLISRTGTTNTQFLYNGRDGVMSDENGLVYMRARYYSPELKRFINADVIAGSITNAITLNRYAYANGNPVSNVDPFGLSPERGGNFSNKNFSPIAFDDNTNDSGVNIDEVISLIKEKRTHSVSVKKYSSSVNLWDWLKSFGIAFLNAIEFEVGGGYGLGVSADVYMAEVELAAYSDVLTIRLDDSEMFVENSGSIGISASIFDMDELSLGISGSYHHDYVDRYTPCEEHTTLSNPLSVATCEYADTSPLSVSVPLIGNISGDFSEDVVIGISGSAHIVLGGHFSIGINVSEIIREMSEQY